MLLELKVSSSLTSVMILHTVGAVSRISFVSLWTIVTLCFNFPQVLRLVWVLCGSGIAFSTSGMVPSATASCCCNSGSFRSLQLRSRMSFEGHWLMLFLWDCSSVCSAPVCHSSMLEGWLLTFRGRFELLSSEALSLSLRGRLLEQLLARSGDFRRRLCRSASRVSDRWSVVSVSDSVWSFRVCFLAGVVVRSGV